MERQRIEDRAWLEDAAVQSVFDALEAAGGTARIAGGAVRNALMGRPITDIDIATDLSPERVQSALNKAGIKTAATGLKHGTLTAIVGSGPDARTFEVTTLRVDVETHGRHATVAFTDDWTADAARRDFTMNALYCDRDGTLFDPIGGFDDVKRRRVVFVGDAAARIEEDYLRILRFFRIHAVYGEGALDRDGLAACLSHADGLARLSAERVRQESWKLFIAPRALEVLGQVHRDGILERVLGKEADLDRFARLAALEADTGRVPDPLLRLAALALETEGDVVLLRERFVLTNKERKRLSVLASLRTGLGPDLDTRTLRRSLYDAGEQSFRDMVLFDLASAGGTPDAAAAAEMLALPEVAPVPPFPLGGRDVVAAGVEPGAPVGRVLDRLEAEWIDSDFSLDKGALRHRLGELIEREKDL